MKRKFAFSLFFLVGLVLLCGCSQYSNAPQVMVSDITAQPSKYFNTTVRITGIVVEVSPQPEGTTRGIYLLRDDYDNTIAVRSNDLPRVGVQFTVTGLVAQDPSTQKPFLRETRRGATGFPIGLIIAAAAVLAILIVILVYLNMDYQKGKKAVQEPARSAAFDKEKTIYEEKKKASPETIYDIETGLMLVVLEGKDKGKKFDLNRPIMTLGRRSSDGRRNDIELAEEELRVSRNQARLTYKDKVFSIENESQGSILVNDKEITEKTSLSPGDVITIGNGTVKLKIVQV